MKLIHLSDNNGNHKLFSKLKYAADWIGTTSAAVNQAIYQNCRAKGWYAWFDLEGSYNSAFIDSDCEPMTEEKLKQIK